ncbi:MAG: hypothetical protein AABZ74_04800 [Cyanobacteriota bacterium]
MKKLLVCFSLFLLTNCSLFGSYTLSPDFPDSQSFFSSDNIKEKIVSKKIEDGLVVSLEWIGNAYPLETSKNLNGSISRFVIPYSRKTALINLKIDNKTKKQVTFDTSNVILKDLSEKKELKPLNIDFFKSLWPSFAVKNQEMLIDQSTALGEVIRTIARDRIITEETEYSSYIPFFRLEKNTKDIEIHVKLKIENDYKDLLFKYTKK